MGYERNDRRYGQAGDRPYGGNDSGDRGRPYGGSDRWDEDRARAYGDYGNYGGSSQSRDYRGDRLNDRGSEYRQTGRSQNDQDRGFFNRAGDEVRSWFGDEEAERRRQRDDQASGNDGSRNHGYQNTGSHGYRSRHDHDPHYRSWRDRQLEVLDRDYDEYHREHQSRFDSEFGSWRQGRQGQRDLLNNVQEHQEVVGSDGQHIGKVDHVRGDRILLTKSDAAAGGQHHSIPSSWIQSVDDKVMVSKTADQAKQHWRDERSDEGGLFGRDDNRSGNDRQSGLNRSFSGTY